jgi:hypothetical protein
MALRAGKVAVNKEYIMVVIPLTIEKDRKYAPAGLAPAD